MINENFLRFFFLSYSQNNTNKPTDQQSDCWSTEAFASDSETHSEDGSNLQRLANQYQTASSLIIDDPLGKKENIVSH